MPDRQEIFEAIEEERVYQEAKWGRLDDINSIGDFLCYMKRYYDNAVIVNDPLHKTRALNNIRKIVTLGVACMEKHGVSSRLAETTGIYDPLDNFPATND